MRRVLWSLVTQRRRVVSRLFESMAASVAIQLVTSVTGIILARGLGVHDRGELAAAILWPLLLLTIGSLGMNDATTFFAARESSDYGVLVGSIAAIWLAQCVILIGLGYFLLPIPLERYGPDVVAASRVYLLSIPGYLAHAYSTSLVQGAQRLSTFQALRFVGYPLTALGIAGAAVGGRLTVFSAVIVYVAMYSVIGVLGVVVALRRPRQDIKVSRLTVKGILAFALRSHTDFVASTFNQTLDQLVVSAFLGPAELGLYVVGRTLSSLVALIGSSVSVVALPAIARLKAGRDRTVLALRFVWSAVIASGVLGACLFALVPWLIRGLFGEAYSDSISVARLLVLAVVIYSVARVLSTVLKAVGRPLDAGIAEFIALGGTMAALAALLPAFGLIGAALASLLAYCLCLVWMLRQVARALELGSSRPLLHTFLRVGRDFLVEGHAALTGGADSK